MSVILDELQARFVPRFKALAAKRLAAAEAASAGRDFDGIADTARDMHAIAGESGLLGLAEIATCARSTETLARTACTSRDPNDLAALVTALGALGRLVASLPDPSKEPE